MCAADGRRVLCTSDAVGDATACLGDAAGHACEQSASGVPFCGCGSDGDCTSDRLCDLVVHQCVVRTTPDAGLDVSADVGSDARLDVSADVSVEAGLDSAVDTTALDAIAVDTAMMDTVFLDAANESRTPDAGITEVGVADAPHAGTVVRDVAPDARLGIRGDGACACRIAVGGRASPRTGGAIGLLAVVLAAWAGRKWDSVRSRA